LSARICYQTACAKKGRFFVPIFTPKGGRIVTLPPTPDPERRITAMQSFVFETMSRKLEQFLYLHDIRWSSSYRNVDGVQVWVYKLTPETQRVINEFREINARKNHLRRA
jgi:hypothetical protein